MDLENTMEIDLIPVGEYQESSNHDGSKCYTCSRCGRMFTVKNGPMGIKQHLVQVHVANREFQVSRATVPRNQKSPAAETMTEKLLTAPTSKKKGSAPGNTKGKKRKAERGEKEKKTAKKPNMDENSVDLDDVVRSSQHDPDTVNENIEKIVDHHLEEKDERVPFDINDTISSTSGDGGVLED